MYLKHCSYDPVALSSYLDGSGGHERVRRLLDMERRAMKWTLALGPRPDTTDLLEANGRVIMARRLLAQAQAPMVIWNGADLAA